MQTVPVSLPKKVANGECDLCDIPILVVDDLEDNRDLLNEMLMSEGHEDIVFATNGVEALQMLESRPDVGLVLLDIMMPGMDGYEACRRITSNPRTADIPIIVITGGGASRDESLRKSFECGALDFIAKPINEVELFGRMRSALSLFRERVRRRENAAALQESQNRYELAVNGVNDGIWDMNLVTQEVYYSPQWKRILGYDEMDASMETWMNLIHPEDKDQVLSAVHEHWERKDKYFASEHRLRSSTGEYKWVFSRGCAQWDDKGSVIRMAGSITDITQRRLLEVQLRQAQQMESIGRLAAGVAHDFNNLLTAILGHTTYIRLRTPPDSQLQPSLISIQKASNQAAELCQQMLAFAGQGRYAAETLDLNSILLETTDLVQVSFSKKITVDVKLFHKSLMAEVDLAQFRQVLLNMLLNAAEAIGEKQGIIAVRTSTVQMTPDFLSDAVLVPKFSEGQFVQIEIADTGCGMSKETLEHIFEPFFTTKLTGRGLGLSAALGIIKAHNGGLKVTSQAGQGTSFRILLPQADLPDRASSSVVDDEIAQWKGSGTVLLVDDDPEVRGLTEILLKELGFNVVMAGDGAEGIQMFLTHANEIVAVILDLTMPQLNGDEVFEQIHAVYPETKVLLASGYSEQEVARKFSRTGLAGFLQKPFTFEQLARKLKHCLGTEATA